MLDTFTNGAGFGALVSIADIDHFDLVDDPFVVAYRAEGGTTRPGAFDASKQYVLRPLSERQQIRDHFVVAALDMLLNGDDVGDSFDGGTFAAQGVSVTLAER